MTIIELLARVQGTLQLEDAQIAAYLKTEATTISKVRAGKLELPAHSKVVLLDTAGFIKLAKTLLSVLPNRAKEKAMQGIRDRALNIAQEKLLEKLGEELQSKEIE
jgi:hypothetical protein